MSEEEKVIILLEQLEKLKQDEAASELLKRQIRELGYSPDKRTWE